MGYTYFSQKQWLTIWLFLKCKSYDNYKPVEVFYVIYLVFLKKGLAYILDGCPK